VETQNNVEQKANVRVAIVGGGCAGLTAAWWLAQEPGYEVHVYEKSWRLGGKGASGRDKHGRIQEHGLHIWLGFYDNAFRMMRECYAQVQENKWGPDHQDVTHRLAHGSFEDAFFPEPHIGVGIDDGCGELEVWSGFLPPAKGLPGDESDAETNPFTLANYLVRCIELLKTLMVSVIGTPADDRPGKARPDKRSATDEAADLKFSSGDMPESAVLLELMTTYLRTGVLTTAAGILQAVTIFENWVRQLNYSPQLPDTALKLFEAVAAQIRKQLREFVKIDQKLRWKTEIIDIVMAIIVGLYRDRVLFQPKGLDTLNNVDYREWLKSHGALHSSVNSRFISGIYDLVFAYEGGDHSKPQLAAGVALRGAMRMFFTYRGAMFWRMRSGMGDAVFAPLYKALAQGTAAKGGRNARSPVHFHFLHSLSDVGMHYGQYSRRVEKLIFDTPSTDRIDEPGAGALDHLGCWPDEDALLVHSDSERTPRQKVLNVGDDFDFVVMAVGFDDFVTVLDAPGSEFFKRMPRKWADMRATVKTVATKAGQAWLSKDVESLGWYRGSGMFSALGMRFQTWADMTHTLATERAWRQKGAGDDPADAARSVAYFCSVMSNTEVKKASGAPERKVMQDLRAMLRRDMKPLWPAPFKNGGSVLRPSLLVGPLHAQANWTGSDRYALSLPKTIEQRISPLDPSVSNMTIAGDWTACGLDAGCVEAAVMSGKLAAHALTGALPALESIIGFDHP
jgi:uncharacterized protein with NAD-binding domain and iron-sulfur cluster